MKQEDQDYKRVYTGSSIVTKMLQDRLESENIFPISKDSLSAGSWGILGTSPSHIQLFVHKDEYEKAQNIVDQAIAEMED